MKLYQFPLSGNCHKVRLMLSLLEQPYEAINLSGAQGEHKSDSFLELNLLGQVPVLVEGETVLRDSQAILFYLAQKYGAGSWWPDEVVFRAQVVAWLSTASNEVARGPNLLRLHRKFGRAIELEATVKVTTDLLCLLNAFLIGRAWLVGGQATIADIAIYPYIALLPEGGVDLSPYADLMRWVRRIQALPNYVGMDGMV